MSSENHTHTVEVLGIDREDPDALLSFIFDHTLMPEFVYHRHWQVGQVVIWDQRCTMHRAEANYSMDERRRLMRTKICGPVQDDMPENSP